MRSSLAQLDLDFKSPLEILGCFSDYNPLKADSLLHLERAVACADKHSYLA